MITIQYLIIFPIPISTSLESALHLNIFQGSKYNCWSLASLGSLYYNVGCEDDVHVLASPYVLYWE